MKILELIPPVVALVAIAAWISSQRQTIASLENETATLRQHITAARSDSGHPPAPASARDKSKPVKNSIDWKKIAAWVNEPRSGNSIEDQRARIRFQQQLQEMSKDDILAAFREIAELDLPEKSREQLEFMFSEPLQQKDPEFALNAYSSHLENSDSGFQSTLSSALGEWAEKDLAAATAWFDRQIASGKFECKSLDGENQGRLRFEASVLGLICADDPAFAEVRIAAYPLHQKLELFRQIDITRMEPAGRKSYVELIRGQKLAAEDPTKTIGTVASKFVYQGGYGTITKFLSEIEATPGERAATVEEAGQAGLKLVSRNKKIGREDVDAMRKWAATQSPGTMDLATGKILGDFALHGNGFEFRDAAAIALEYHERGAGDDVIVSLLDSHAARQNHVQAVELAGKITDATAREKTVANLNKSR